MSAGMLLPASHASANHKASARLFQPCRLPISDERDHPIKANRLKGQLRRGPDDKRQQRAGECLTGFANSDGPSLQKDVG